MLELYLMWKWRQSYRDVNTKVKAARNVASPNAGFIVQLMMWCVSRPEFACVCVCVCVCVFIALLLSGKNVWRHC